ncbi:hypothetical protein HGRIS_011238 [Hohenbuehelia grisea]|uniref:CCAAT-binding factor domain-containing protein n=1 Tax=Hohenbuehelia grisea TaxID=104357 RepID=A0ABR3JUG0_9AGAR
MPTLRSLPPPSKKRKISGKNDFADTLKRLETQLISSCQSNRSLNPLADLLEQALRCDDPQNTSKAIYSLYRVFVVILDGDKLSPSPAGEEAKVVKAWLWERLNAYVDFLASLLQDEEKYLRTSALQILFSLLKHLSTTYSKPNSGPQFHALHFRRIVAALLLCPPSARPGSDAQAESEGILDADVRDMFVDTWLSVHDDIRWFFLRDSPAVLQKSPKSRQPAVNLLSILSRLTTFPTDASELNAWWVAELGVKPKMPKKKTGSQLSDDDDDDDPLPKDSADDDDDDDWRKFFDEPAPDDSAKKPKAPGARLHKLTLHQSLHSLPSHRAVFTRAWLTLLPRLSPPSTAKGARHTMTEEAKGSITRTLNVMHRGVLPHLTRPVLVMDWIGACVDYGGSIGLLAMNALFVLMKEYNLDYPSFYTHLYAFLDRDVLHLKYRARFFRMTELFLSSTHLPATILASFVKRLARLSLSAPPPAVVMIIPFTYNILKRHPALMVMIHRTSYGEGEGDDSSDTDPYSPTEPNPLLTRALDSSLWELVTHKEHYHSSVATLAKIFGEAFTKPGYAMEDFLDHTYATLFDTEATRKIRKEPALAVDAELGTAMFSQLFPVASALADGEEDEGVAEVQLDVVGQLWDFS